LLERRSIKVIESWCTAIPFLIRAAHSWRNCAARRSGAQFLHDEIDEPLKSWLPSTAEIDLPDTGNHKAVTCTARAILDA